jgi:hypothetical protein
MSLAQDISAMETEIEQLRRENDIQRQHVGILEFENEQLRRSIDKALAERDVYMRRGEAIRSLLDSTGAMLVNSIKKFHDSERELEINRREEPRQLEGASDRAA